MEKLLTQLIAVQKEIKCELNQIDRTLVQLIRSIENMNRPKAKRKGEVKP